MAQLELRGPYHPLGPDSPRELEFKLNHNYAELCAAAGVQWRPLRLTYATGSGALDTMREVEAKLNGTNAALAAAAGQAAPPAVQLTYALPSYGVYAGPQVAPPAAAGVASALSQPAVLQSISAGLRKLALQALVPVFTAPPVITPPGGAVGTQFSTTLGAAVGADSFSLRWFADGVPVATGSVYTPTQAGMLHVESTATAAGGSSKQSSTPVAVTVSAGPTNTAAPQVTGAPKVGLPLAATTGTWTGSPQSYAYVWRVAGTSVPGASTSAYTPTPGDAGKQVTVQVTATNAGGSSGSATSAPTAAVAA